jgi:hypothetical protein
MSGGTALSADQSPPPSPGQQDRAPGSGQDSKDRPRPFFAETGDDAPSGATSDKQPDAPRSIGPLYGQPNLRGPQYPGQPLSRPEPPAQPQQPDWPQAQQRQAAQPPRPRSKAPGSELRQRAIATLIFGAVSLVALLGLGSDLRKGVYVLGFSALIGLAACIIGITALVKARRTGSYRPRGAIGGIVLGAIGMLISIPILLTYLAFPTQVNNYVNCLSQTQGHSSAENTCISKFYKSIGLDSTP